MEILTIPTLEKTDLMLIDFNLDGRDYHFIVEPSCMEKDPVDINPIRQWSWWNTDESNNIEFEIRGWIAPNGYAAVDKFRINVFRNNHYVEKETIDNFKVQFVTNERQVKEILASVVQ